MCKHIIKAAADTGTAVAAGVHSHAGYVSDAQATILSCVAAQQATKHTIQGGAKCAPGGRWAGACASGTARAGAGTC